MACCSFHSVSVGNQSYWRLASGLGTFPGPVVGSPGTAPLRAPHIGVGPGMFGWALGMPLPGAVEWACLGGQTAPAACEAAVAWTGRCSDQ